jgi:hypothetical protein
MLVEFLKRRSAVLAAIGLAGAVASTAAFVTQGRAQTPAPPASTSPPIVLGSFQVGSTLSLLPGSWTGEPAPAFTYQWLSCAGPALGDCSPIPGQTAVTFTPVDGNLGQTVRAQVTGTNPAGFAVATSAAVGPIVETGSAPLNLFPPSIQGPAPPVLGEALTAQPGIWNPSPDATSFQWLRCDAQGEDCAPIASATQAQYSPVQADTGSSLRVSSPPRSSGELP